MFPIGSLSHLRGQGISTEVRNVLRDSFDDLLETLIVLAFSLARMCQEGTELMCLAMYKESCMVAETPFSPPKRRHPLHLVFAKGNQLSGSVDAHLKVQLIFFTHWILGIILTKSVILDYFLYHKI